MSDTPNGETAMTQPLDNNVNGVTTTPVVNVDPAVAEAVKRAEQAQMEANMLRNKLKALEDAESAAKSAQLEEQQEYKTLYEQEKAERQRIALESEAESKKQTLASEESKIIAQYAPEVLEIAKELGFGLTDANEDAVAAFKSKLDKVSEKVGAKIGVQPNNTRTVANPQSREELLAQYRKTGDRKTMDRAIAELSFVKPYTQQ